LAQPDVSELPGMNHRNNFVLVIQKHFGRSLQ
jgi:hypothetical protein